MKLSVQAGVIVIELQGAEGLWVISLVLCTDSIKSSILHGERE